MANCIAEPLSRKDIQHMAEIVRTIEGSSGSLSYLMGLNYDL